MPFMTYHGSIDSTLVNVGRLMREGLPQSVKMEGGTEIAATVAACVQAGVPVRLDPGHRRLLHRPHRVRVLVERLPQVPPVTR